MGPFPWGDRGAASSVPRGSYPTPFLGYLVLCLGSVILKSRHPKQGVGYEPLGVRKLLDGVSKRLKILSPKP